MFRTIQFVLVVAVALFGMSAVAQAAHIPLLYNNTDSLIVLDDDFEGHSVGYLADNTTVNALVGTWTGSNYGSTAYSIRIEDEAAAGFAAQEGSQFMGVFRGSSSINENVLGTGIAANSGAGDLLTFTTAWRYTGLLADSAGLFMRESDGTLITRFTLGGEGIHGKIRWYDGAWHDIAQTAGPVDTWNTLVISHVNGTYDWSISINGQTPTTITTSTTYGSDGAWSSVDYMTANSYAAVRFDAVVPEPGTLALLATGLIGLLCYAWRKRK